MTITAPSPPAERQRRRRERKRRGARCMRGDVPADTLRAMINNDWLDPNEAKNPEKLGAALIDLADCWMRGTLTSPRS